MQPKLQGSHRLQPTFDIAHTLKWSFWVPFDFILGLAFGSFLNVCIYRLPRQMNVAKPRSMCPRCQSPIAAYDNIPVLSWFILRGKCRNCKEPISARYWIIELLIGCLFALSAAICGGSLGAVKLCIGSFLLVGLIFTDADTKLLPDLMTIPGILAGLVMSYFVRVDPFILVLIIRMHPHNIRPEWLSVADSAAGAVVGAGFIWGAAWLYKFLRGVEGMGFGDVKLMAMVGAFLGIPYALNTIMLGSVLGAISGVVLIGNVFRKRLQRRHRVEPAAEKRSRAWYSARLIMRYYEMPFGVFLGLVALLFLFIDAIVTSIPFTL